MAPTAAGAERLTGERDPAITTMAAAIRFAGEAGAPTDERRALVILQPGAGERRLTYPELWLSARRAAEGLRARGVRRGDRVILLVSMSEDYLATVCGAILLGALPATIAGPTSFTNREALVRRVKHVYDALEPALVIVPPAFRDAEHWHEVVDPARLATAEEVLAEDPIATGLLPQLGPDDLNHIQMTSGSTSRPKAVALSHAAVLSNVRAIAAAVDLAPSTEVGLTWLPLYHDMGFVQVLLAIYYRMTFIVMPSSAFLRNPLSWLSNISAYGVAHSSAPTFAYALCVQRFDPRKLDGVDLRSWRRAFVGAEPVALSVLNRFRETFQPYGLSDDVLYPCYGMAETVVASTLVAHAERSKNRLFGCVSCDFVDPERLRREGRAEPVGVDPAAVSPIAVVGLGQPAQGLTISIRDPHGRPLPDRAAGEVWLRGTSLMSGYFGDPQASAAALQDGWLRTGDRGYLVDGELYVLGRLKDLIIVRGRNFEPHDIEAVIEAHPAVRDNAAVAFGVYDPEKGTDDVIAVAETRISADDVAPVTREIQESLQATFGFRAREIVMVPHGAIPRTTSYKKQRSEAERRYRDGRFAGISVAAQPVTEG